MQGLITCVLYMPVCNGNTHLPASIVTCRAKPRGFGVSITNWIAAYWAMVAKASCLVERGGVN